MFRLAAVAVSVAALGAPVGFLQPTSIELLPDGKLLVVENSPGRLLKVDPRSGRVAVVVGSMLQPYSVVRARSGAIYVSVGTTIRRVGGGVVVRRSEQIGPIAAEADGTLVYATGTAVFRGTTELAGELHGPHGLAAANDGSVLVADTGANRILRIADDGTVTTFARVTNPRGLDVARSGTVYVVQATARRVARLTANGRPLGYLGPRLPGDPYDLQVAADGSVYVLEAGAVGDIRLLSPRGRMTVLRRR